MADTVQARADDRDRPARWWGRCERCGGPRVVFLAYLPGTTTKVCAACYERAREQASS